MPGLTSQVVIMQHNSASDFLSFASPTLRRNEASSNIVFAHALKGVSSDVAMGGFQFTCDSDVMKRLDNTPASSFPANRNNDCFWLTVWTRTQSSIPSLDLVLSCVKWKLGNYPIFLWTSNLPFSHDSQWLLPRISKLAEHLRKCVPIERVFSVFGMTILVKTFSTLWSSITGLEVEPSPFYAAFFSYCDSDTFRSSNAVLPQGHCLRRAELAELEQVTQLCKEFADDSVYFPLSLEKAREEAQGLILKRQIWVYEANGDITTVCGVTRNTYRVSAITKVYTAPKWRRRGCAEFLVRDVTAKLLFECGQEVVVLYVGYENSAQYVYDRVGFQGLCGKPRNERIEDSLELGFVNTKRGHW